MVERVKAAPKEGCKTIEINCFMEFFTIQG